MLGMHQRTIFPYIHLFAYRYQEQHCSLTKNAFLKKCNLIWHNAGYPRMMGHSFRIGGTTELLVAGVHPGIVMAVVLHLLQNDFLMLRGGWLALVAQ
jgi:hypothetical protein